jgi:hypothetical protein
MANDKHPDTQEVHKWLAEMAANAPDCLDIFLEDNTYFTGFFAREKHQDEIRELDVSQIETLKQMHVKFKEPQFSGLVASTHVFQPCLRESRLNCYGMNVRFHNVDLRNIFKESREKDDPNDPKTKGDVLDIKAQMQVMAARAGVKPTENYYVGLGRVIWSCEKMDDMLTMAVNSCRYIAGREMYKKYYYKMVRQVVEEFDNRYEISPGQYDFDMHDAYIKRTYMHRIHKQQKKIGTSLSNKLLESLMIAWTIPTFQRWVHKRGPNCMVDVYLWVEVFIVDYYTLLRLFTIFNDYMMIRGPDGCTGSENRIVRNAIVYLGVEHVRAVKATLNHMGYKADRDTIDQPNVSPEDIENYLVFDDEFDFWSN